MHTKPVKKGQTSMANLHRKHIGCAFFPSAVNWAEAGTTQLLFIVLTWIYIMRHVIPSCFYQQHPTFDQNVTCIRLGRTPPTSGRGCWWGAMATPPPCGITCSQRTRCSTRACLSGARPSPSRRTGLSWAPPSPGRARAPDKLLLHGSNTCDFSIFQVVHTHE